MLFTWFPDSGSVFIYYLQDIADPFFAYCKMHADKNMARAKRRNWLAIQSHVKQHAGHSIDDEKEKVVCDLIMCQMDSGYIG